MGYNFITQICVICIVIVAGVVKCGEYCLSDDGREVIYCDHGCCGDDHDDQHCCLPVVWIVVGCVLGGLFIIGVIIVIVCIFYKSKGKSGRVIQPQGGTQTVAYTTTNIQHGFVVQPTAPPAPPPYGFNYQQQPPPYSQQYGQQSLPPLYTTQQQHNQYGTQQQNTQFSAQQQTTQYSTQQQNSGNTTDPAFPPPPPAQYNN